MLDASSAPTYLCLKSCNRSREEEDGAGDGRDLEIRRGVDLCDLG